MSPRLRISSNVTANNSKAFEQICCYLILLTILIGERYEIGTKIETDNIDDGLLPVLSTVRLRVLACWLALIEIGIR